MDGERAGHELELDPRAAAEIDRQVDEFIGQAQKLAGRPGEQAGLVEALGSLGARDMRATAALSGRMVARAAAAMRALSGEEGSVGRGLDELRRMATSLQAELPFAAREPRRRLLGILPAADPVDAFITRSERAQEKVNALLGGLREAQQALRSDNAAIGQDLVALETQVEALRRHAYMAARIDHELAQPASAAGEPVPPPSQDVVFAVRQRRRDLLTHLAIAMQGQAALRVVQENNAELIRAVEAATTTTAAALRTSTVVAQALLTQRLVRNRLDDAQRALQGGARGHDVELQNLRTAWATVEGTLEQVHTFRAQALTSLASTAGTLQTNQRALGFPGKI